MSPDAKDLKEQIKMAEQHKKDAQKLIAEEKKMLKKQMAEHDKHIADLKKEKNTAATALNKLAM